MATEKIVKQRSPNYPGIDLAEAIRLTRLLYQRVQRGEFLETDAASAWSYQTVSGPVRVRLAALKQYGLIDQPRGGKGKLSNRALTVVLRNEASKEYLQARTEAALNPSLFRELQPKLTSTDDALKQDLIVGRRFTDDGADRFIGVLRATMALANPSTSGIISGQEEDITEHEEGEDMLEPPPTKETITIPIPFSPERIGRLIIPAGMTAEDWKRLDRILAAYKPDTKESAHSEQDTGTPASNQ